MDWTPYNPCCHRRALDPAAQFCPDCSHPLLRCPAFAECQSLVTPFGHCPVHVAPQLQLVGSAPPEARAGEQFDLALTLTNAARVGHPLKLLHLYRLNPPQEPFEVVLPWERLDPDQTRPLSLPSGVLASAGSYRLGLVLVLGAWLDGREEHYAFSGEIELRVSGADPQQIVQHIHMEGAHLGTGAAGVLQTGPSTAAASLAQLDAASRAPPLALERAERFELQAGIRGYAEAGLRLPATVQVCCDGFPAGEAPPSLALFRQQRALRCGRNGIRFDATHNPEPNALCLRVHRADGKLDRERSLTISRQHFELFLQHDRLNLRALGGAGTWLNGERLEFASTRIVRDGDHISPFPGATPALALRVGFSARDGSVDSLHLSRLQP